MKGFRNRWFVLRVDEATARTSSAALCDDIAFLLSGGVRPVLVAPSARAARALVRAMNRARNVAVALSGSDAALLPGTPEGIASVQPGILRTLGEAGYVPVVAPTAFLVFGDRDVPVTADDAAAAIAGAVEAVRAVFFHRAGGVEDPQTHAILHELTPAEALALADDERLPEDLRAAMRAAARGVRHGVAAAQIVDGRIAHAAVVELLTEHPVGTRITGSVLRAA